MIRLTDVNREYRGTGGAFARPVRALDGVSVEIAAGSAVGFIGLNGAGKTTLLRVLLGYTRPSAGEAAIADLAPRAYVERHGVGYVPERVAIPGGWTVRGALRAYAALGEVGADTPARVEAALERLGLEPLADRTVRTLSKGNLQRLAIAQALLADRKLMVLDEPTDALDPVWTAELRRILAEWRAADPERVLVLASHDLPQVERIVDRVLVLHAGKIRAQIDLKGQPRVSLEERFLRLVAGWSEEAA